MLNARLEISKDCSLDISADDLANIVNALPERRGTSKLYKVLARSSSAKVRQAVANKSPLSDETVRLLSQDRTQAVLIALLNNDAANQRIAKSKIAEWIADDDVDMLQTIFQNLKNLTQLDTAHIFYKFARHFDAAIRLEVALSSDTDVETLELLTTDEDSEVCEVATNTLHMRDPIDPDENQAD